jgi:hypothetical protein
MTLSDLASLGSFISGAAVAVSLIFLALQMRQTNRNQKAEMQQARAARLVEFNLQAGNPEIALVIQRGGTGDLTLNDAEIASFRRTFIATILNFEDGYFQAKDKMIGTRSLASDRAILKSLFVQRGYRAMWKTLRYAFEPEFTAYVDDMIETTPIAPIPDPGATWKALVQQEGSQPS